MDSLIENLIGVPYVDYGNSPAEGFHCTGLIRYLAKEKMGKVLPEDPMKWKSMFFDLGWPVPLRDSDVLIMRNEDDEPHVGWIVGTEDCLHAWRPAGGVVLQRVKILEKVITSVARFR